MPLKPPRSKICVQKLTTRNWNLKWRDNTISSNDLKCRKPYKSCPAAERICVISFGQCYSWTRENFSYFFGCLLNRCIKPNSYQSPDRFDPDTVLVQVRALAVVQTIQMRNFGFPVWFPFDVFIKRLTYLLFCFSGISRTCVGIQSGFVLRSQKSAAGMVAQKAIRPP